METLIDWGLVVFKFASIGLAGVFGIVALLVDYRDKDGQITLWGRRALYGVIGSTAIAAVTAGLEVAKGASVAAKTAAQTLEQTQKTNQIINNINRSLHPFKDLEFAFWADVSLQPAELQAYKNRVTTKIKAAIAGRKGQSFALNTDGFFVSVADRNGDPLEISIPLGSDLFPSEDNETTAYYLLRYVDYFVNIYTQPISYETLAKPQQTWPQSDLSIYINTSKQDQFGLALQYDLNGDSFSIHATSLKSDQKYWQSNGKIISLLDLAGAQIIISTMSVMSPSLNGDHSALVKARSSIDLNRLNMAFAGSRTYRFRKDRDMKSFLNPNGLKDFVIDIPSDADMLNAYRG
jgi:hypothetical protein